MSYWSYNLKLMEMNIAIRDVDWSSVRMNGSIW